METALQVKLNTFKTNLVVYNRLALDRLACSRGFQFLNPLLGRGTSWVGI